MLVFPAHNVAASLVCEEIMLMTRYVPIIFNKRKFKHNQKYPLIL